MWGMNTIAIDVISWWTRVVFVDWAGCEPPVARIGGVLDEAAHLRLDEVLTEVARPRQFGHQVVIEEESFAVELRHHLNAHMTQKQ